MYVAAAAACSFLCRLPTRRAHAAYVGGGTGTRGGRNDRSIVALLCRIRLPPLLGACAPVAPAFFFLADKEDEEAEDDEEAPELEAFDSLREFVRLRRGDFGTFADPRREIEGDPFGLFAVFLPLDRFFFALPRFRSLLFPTALLSAAEAPPPAPPAELSALSPFSAAAVASSLPEFVLLSLPSSLLSGTLNDRRLRDGPWWAPAFPMPSNGVHLLIIAPFGVGPADPVVCNGSKISDARGDRRSSSLLFPLPGLLLDLLLDLLPLPPPPPLVPSMLVRPPTFPFAANAAAASAAMSAIVCVWSPESVVMLMATCAEVRPVGRAAVCVGGGENNSGSPAVNDSAR